MKQTKSNRVICAGQFSGGEIEPGTFHGGEIEPGTFHGPCPISDTAFRVGDEEPKKVAKTSGSDAESSDEDETPSGNGESQD